MLALNWHAFAMACIAGLSTGIGGLLVIFGGKPSPKSLGYLLSFSAGVMLYISFMDLLPEAVHAIGFTQANLAVRIRHIMDFFFYVFWFYRFVHPYSDAFFSGMLIFGLLAQLVPNHEHAHDHGKKTEKEKKKENPAGKVDPVYLKRVGILTALSISLHNFPEGIAVYLACLKGLEVGFPIAIAIAAHNIPEGMAVASPIYHSTGSKWQALKWSLVSGFCEPIAAFIFGTLLSTYITDEMVQLLLAGVAGIMVLVSMKELLPVAFEYLSPEESMVSSAFGMIFISVSIYMLHFMGGHDHSHGGHDHGHSHAANGVPEVMNMHSHAHAHDHHHGHDHHHHHDHDHDHHHH